MPADSARRGEVVEAPQDWRFDPAVFDLDVDVVVWGRTADRRTPLGVALGRAAAREATLRRLRRRLPARLHLVAVHRLPPRRLQAGGARGALRTAVRGGALAELSSLPSGARVLDRVLAEAGVRGSENSFHAGAGGAMVIRAVLTDGSRALLRLARSGTPGDPAPTADTLDRLARAAVPLTPRLHSRGITAGASWVVEHSLPGRRPARATDALIREVAEVCATFPRDDGPPTATAADLAGIAALLPERADAIGRLAAELSGRVEGLPAVLRHGDLWAGNLLVARGRLAGLVDWDAAHPAGMPGADLLQLVATEFRRGRRALGGAFLCRPLRLPMFMQAAGRYWTAVGIRPDADLLDTVGFAWWATEVHGTLARLPHRARDERWVETNVDRVLSALGD
jgi:hypothetical protein